MRRRLRYGVFYDPAAGDHGGAGTEVAGAAGTASAGSAEGDPSWLRMGGGVGNITAPSRARARVQAREARRRVVFLKKPPDDRYVSRQSHSVVLSSPDPVACRGRQA